MTIHWERMRTCTLGLENMRNQAKDNSQYYDPRIDFYLSRLYSARPTVVVKNNINVDAQTMRVILESERLIASTKELVYA